MYNFFFWVFWLEPQKSPKCWVFGWKTVLSFFQPWVFSALSFLKTVKKKPGIKGDSDLKYRDSCSKTCLSLRLGLAALSCSIGLRNCLKNLSLWACSSKEQIVILGQLFRPQDKFSGLIFAPRTKYFVLECHFVL